MGPIWDPSGQPAYGLTHMGPMLNPVALPIWVPYGWPIWDPYRHVCWVLEPQEFRQTLCDTAVVLAILTAFYLGVERSQFS